jgi:L-asparagine transporter-like permease
VIWRISVFSLSIFVIISVVPWNDPLLPVQGSYQGAGIMNIPNAKLLVDMVVLVAVASCLNSSIYIASRMLFSGQARRCTGGHWRTSGRVPRAAVIGSTLIGMLTTVVNYFAPRGVRVPAGQLRRHRLLVYLVIACSQLRMRARWSSRTGEIAFKMWLFPWLTWAVIGFIVFALG